MRIYNTRIFEFNPSVIDPRTLKGVTHVRGFSPDFSQSIQPGELFKTVSQEKLIIWADWVKENGFKVVWTLAMTKDRTLISEITILKQLINYGVEVEYVQFGGEFWLGKYFEPDLTEKGVVERVTIDDYLVMLDEWIPAVRQHAPDSKLMLLGCSHNYSQEEVINVLAQFELQLNGDVENLTLGTFKFYRIIWNDKVVKYAQSLPFTVGFTVHYYAGAKPDLQPANGEEAIFEGINWDVFIDQLRWLNPNAEIIIPEGAWYVTKDFNSKSPEEQALEFENCKQFLAEGKAKLEPNGIVGLHVLQSKGSITSLHTMNGITPLGELYAELFDPTEVTPEPEPEPEPPVTLKLVILGDLKGTRNWSFRLLITTLYFSDGTKHKVYTRFGATVLFGKEDVGKTKAELFDELLNKG